MCDYALLVSKCRGIPTLRVAFPQKASHLVEPRLTINARCTNICAPRRLGCLPEFVVENSLCTIEHSVAMVIRRTLRSRILGQSTMPRCHPGQFLTDRPTILNRKFRRPRTVCIYHDCVKVTVTACLRTTQSGKSTLNAPASPFSLKRP
jgi:hypothetical protein